MTTTQIIQTLLEFVAVIGVILCLMNERRIAIIERIAVRKLKRLLCKVKESIL